jgi:hypothetical protein
MDESISEYLMVHEHHLAMDVEAYCFFFLHLWEFF